MKLKFWLALITFTLFVIGSGGMALAFHDGGVAECGGCHSMHSPNSAGTMLLIGGDQSSTCLSCHMHAGDTGPSSYHVATADADMPAGKAPIQRSPGGDFGWLKKTYNFTVRSTATTELGQSHGHNIVAADYGYVADSSSNTAPGGTFPSANLACNSCHDPHGKYRRLSNGTIVTAGAPIIASGSYNNSFGNSSASPIPAGQAVGAYRLLGGSGYSNTVSGTIGYPGVPAAVAPSTYNRTEATQQTRVAYGTATTGGHQTWANWCATCHTKMHSTGNYVHPVDVPMSSTIRTNYTNYVNSSNTTGGVFAGDQAGMGPFSTLNPFMENTTDYTVLGSHAKIDGTYLNGPVAGDQVSCLSCHRAHASGWPEALRWNAEYEIISWADAANNPIWAGIDGGSTVSAGERNRGRTQAETLAAYYDRPAKVFGAYQRSLCNKCHAKD